jgi:hypothetical protein
MQVLVVSWTLTLSSPNSSLSLVSSQHTVRKPLSAPELAARQAEGDARDVDTVKRWEVLWVLRNGAAKGRFTKEVIRDILKSLHELQYVRSIASLDDHLKKLGDMYNKRNAPASAAASVSEP